MDNRIILFNNSNIEKNIVFVGTQAQPDFVFGTRAVQEAQKNLKLAEDLQFLLNKYLKINLYSDNEIEHLHYIFVLYPQNWIEYSKTQTKYYSRKNKTLYIDVILPDYDEFCNADKTRVINILAEQTLIATEKYLSKIKKFDYLKYFDDLKQVFNTNLNKFLVCSL